MSTVEQAVVLAGGRGERLRPLTDSIPKPLAPVNGTPFLDYLIESLIAAGFKRVLLLLGYRADMIMDRYSSGVECGVDIAYSVGSVDDQTGRRLLNAYDGLDDHFLLLYGDNYWPIELDAMLELYRRTGSNVLMTVFGNRDGTGEYGRENNVETELGLVRAYDPARKAPGLNGVNMGYYLVARRHLDQGLHGNPSFEEDMVPGLISQRRVAGYVTNAQYYYITDMDCLDGFSYTAVQQGFQPLRWGNTC